LKYFNAFARGQKTVDLILVWSVIRVFRCRWLGSITVNVLDSDHVVVGSTFRSGQC